MEEIHLPTPSEIRQKINNGLNEQEMTQKELASRINTAESTFSGYINGNRELSYETIHQAWRVFQQENSIEGRTAADLMEPDIVWAELDDKYDETARIMMNNAYTQLPVRENGNLVGWITTELLAEKKGSESSIGGLMHDESFGTIEPYATEEAVRDALTGDSAYRALLVVDGDDEYVGILTREDLVRAKVETE